MIAHANTHPGLGVYPGLPDAEYHAWDLPSNSRLTDLDHSPELCAWARKHRKERTDAMRLGTAVHTALLEPDRLEREFVEPEPCSGVIAKTGKACGAMSAKPYGDEDSPDWFCGRHNKDLGDPLDLETLTAGQRAALGHMKTSVFRFGDAVRLLDGADDRELSIVFEQMGMLCKARVDFYLKGSGGILGDVKTCPDSTEDAFGRKLFTMGYFRQLAMYRRALIAHGKPVAFAAIVAVQSTEPYAVRVYQIPGEQLDLGDADLDRLLAEYQRREADNDWIGHGGKAVTLPMPEWAKRKIEQRVEAAATA